MICLTKLSVAESVQRQMIPVISEIMNRNYRIEAAVTLRKALSRHLPG